MTLSFFGGRLRVNLLLLPVAAFMMAVSGIDRAVAFFCALLLHEGAHGAAASALGVRVESVELLPFGCAANMESMALVSAGSEAIIAAAGPCANILFAALLGCLPEETVFSAALFNSNAALACINLLPALPMDGGRIFASVLRLGLTPARAAKISGAIGAAAGACVFAAGVYMAVCGEVNPTLFIVGAFMSYSGIKYVKSSEFMYMRRLTALPGEMARRGSAEVRTLAMHENHTLGEALTRMDARHYNVVRVVGDDMCTVKTLDQGEVTKAILKHSSGEKLGKV